MEKKIIGNKRKGFTLLELLVVISIIGILVALGAVAFSTAQKKGRDAKRRGDMKAMQNAFEQYYAVNSTYSATCSTMWTSTQSSGSFPDDPVPSKDYFSSCATNPTPLYSACALLDETGTGNYLDSAAVTAGGGKYFCVKKFQ